MRRTTAAAVTAVALILGTVALTLPSVTPTKGINDDLRRTAQADRDRGRDYPELTRMGGTAARQRQEHNDHQGELTMGFNDPGVPGRNLPAGEDHVMRSIKDLERWAREALPSVARSFAPVVARLDAADAAFAAQDAAFAVQQVTLDAQQATLTTTVADIAANVASINDLLTKVVKPQSVYFAAPNFAMSTTGSAKASATITVPAGFTTAMVNVVARIYARNANTTGGWNGAGGDFLYASAKIASVAGNATPVRVDGSGDSNVGIGPLATVLTGLTPGGTFVIEARAATLYLSWPADVYNAADVTGTILWLR